MFVFFMLSLLIATSQQQPAKQFIRSEGALEYKTLEVYKFKGIPKFADLAKDEKRELYYYEQTVVVRDSGQQDNKVCRCEIMEVYQKPEADKVLKTLSLMFHLKVQTVNMEKMMNLMNDCDSVDNIKNKNPNEETTLEIEEDLRKANSIFNGIIPGTNWCGFGDIAENYHDLARFRNLDRCCRAHDLCPIKVLAKDERYNLTNKAVYTKSHCLCDEAFYGCLKKDNGWSAKIIGNLYFYAAKPECVKGLPEFPKEEMKFVPATRKW